jgi:hypothetical protein
VPLTDSDALCELLNQKKIPLGAVADCVEIRWRVFELHDAIRSCGEVNDMIGRLFGEALPACDFPHDDLT